MQAVRKLRMVLAQRCQDGGRGDSWDTSGAARCLSDLSREDLRHHDCHFGHLPGLQSMTHERTWHMCFPFSNLILGVPCAKDGRGGRRRRGLFLNISFSISAGRLGLDFCYLRPPGHLKLCKAADAEAAPAAEASTKSPKKPFSSNKQIGENHPLKFDDTQWRNENVRLIDGQLPLPPRLSYKSRKSEGCWRGSSWGRSWRNRPSPIKKWQTTSMDALVV